MIYVRGEITVKDKTGLDRTIHRFRRRAHDLPRNVATSIKNQAQAMAPVRTGYLKQSIHTERRGTNDWQVVVGASYGVYVEQGTRHMAAQPFLRPAVRAVMAGPLRNEVRQLFG